MPKSSVQPPPPAKNHREHRAEWLTKLCGFLTGINERFDSLSPSDRDLVSDGLTNITQQAMVIERRLNADSADQSAPTARLNVHDDDLQAAVGSACALLGLMPVVLINEDRQGDLHHKTPLHLTEIAELAKRVAEQLRSACTRHCAEDPDDSLLSLETAIYHARAILAMLSAKALEESQAGKPGQAPAPWASNICDLADHVSSELDKAFNRHLTLQSQPLAS
ncbi:MAG: hypothetical protein KIT44_02750 [Opitutaceae bacterium]|nr:hypothetical protein [Opitutaceae bacterium]